MQSREFNILSFMMIIIIITIIIINISELVNTHDNYPCP